MNFCLFFMKNNKIFLCSQLLKTTSHMINRNMTFSKSTFWTKIWTINKSNSWIFSIFYSWTSHWIFDLLFKNIFLCNLRFYRNLWGIIITKIKVFFNRFFLRNFLTKIDRTFCLLNNLRLKHTKTLRVLFFILFGLNLVGFQTLFFLLNLIKVFLETKWYLTVWIWLISLYWNITFIKTE